MIGRSNFIKRLSESAMLDAREAVKMLLAINGGAAVSILALIGGLLTQKAPQLIEAVAESLTYFAIRAWIVEIDRLLDESGVGLSLVWPNISMARGQRGRRYELAGVEFINGWGDNLAGHPRRRDRLRGAPRQEGFRAIFQLSVRKHLIDARTFENVTYQKW